MKKFIFFVLVIITIFGCSQKSHNFIKVESDPTSTISLDLRGKKITTYIAFEIVENLKKLKEQEFLEIITDNYSAIKNDMNAWAISTGNQITILDESDKYFKIQIKKTTIKTKPKIFAFIISESGLEELLSPLGFALGAALSGHEVNLYFQGPAVHIFEKGFKAKLSGFNSIFSGFARDGLNEIGHIPAQNKLIQLHKLGAKLYVCGPSMDHFGVKQSDFIFSDIIVAEYLSFIEILQKADVKFFL